MSVPMASAEIKSAGINFTCTFVKCTVTCLSEESTAGHVRCRAAGREAAERTGCRAAGQEAVAGVELIPGQAKCRAAGPLRDFAAFRGLSSYGPTASMGN